MNRPVIVAAVCLAAASAIGTQTGLLLEVPLAVWLVIAGAAVLLGGFHRGLARALPYVILAAAACLYVGGYQRVTAKPVQSLARKDVLSVRAVVLDYADQYEETQRVPLRITAVGTEAPGDLQMRPFKTLCYLPVTPELLEPGDQIETCVSFYIPDVRDGFARQEYYATNGYFVLARQAEEAEAVHVHNEPVWWSYPLRLARELKLSVSRQFPEREAGLLNAILFGDRSGMAPSDSRNLRKAGLSHMTAVSGMHVGFLVTFFCIVLGKKFGSIVSVAAILCFIPMAGASPSVIRAAVMYIIMIVSFLRFEESETLNSLAAALTVLLLTNPYSIASASLLLSFGATLGLLLFSGRIQRLLMEPVPWQNWMARKPVHAFASVISCSFSTMVFTTPVLLAGFGYITVLSVLANLLTLPVIGAAFVLGLLVSFCGLLMPTGWELLANAEQALLSYILQVSDGVAHLPFGVLSWGDLLGKTAVSGFYIGLFLLVLFHRKKQILWVLIPVCMLLAGCSFWTAKEIRESTRLTVLPSGAGQTMVYSTGPGALTVIDCGGDKGHDSAEAVVEFLDWNGFEAVDTMILTAVDQSHARYAAKLLRTGLVRSLVIPEIPQSRQKELYMDLISAAEEADVQYCIGIPYKLPEGITVSDEIERKLVVYLTLGDKQVMTVHSLTQKMLAEFLETAPVQTDILLLSEHNIEDADMLRAALEVLQPEDLILECGYIENESLLRRPCHNTKLEGSIILSERKGGGVKWQ